MTSKIKLLIADRDREYGDTLAAQILLTGGEFSVAVSAVATAAQIGADDYDFILLDEESSKEFWNEKESSLHLSLEARQKLLKKCVILAPKYGSVAELVSRLLLLDVERTGKSRVLWESRKSKVSLIGFLSGSGGNGKTCAALAFARFLARERNRRVLYLSLEELDGAAFYLGQADREQFLDDFLYYFFSANRENRTSVLRAFFRPDRYGVKTLPSGRLRNELLSLSEKELAALMEALLQYGEIDEIVVDFPLLLRDEAALLIKSCRALVLVNTGGAYRLARHERLKYVLQELGIEKERLFELQTEWEQEMDAEWEAADIYHDLGKEVSALAERMGTNE